ncbi:MAG: hypothetical protein BECKG1743D_GA0114223_102773 [Candidatus Kentron sp. G]|nr:MAG: hypothetical protein BECKG1743F_GA0114225_102353 [Candidatus Kentron sp. G]VFM99689.1 MAG: hypothetical protein BECKG1743E_GA0114224_102743 [Candidatus Kentron sp. G]VFN01410.1 MAG: hypothetical protein BECKG1743D_GA0114223_102773 [Candidatus Kentron sp. G]
MSAHCRRGLPEDTGDTHSSAAEDVLLLGARFTRPRPPAGCRSNTRRSMEKRPCCGCGSRSLGKPNKPNLSNASQAAPREYWRSFPKMTNTWKISGNICPRTIQWRQFCYPRKACRWIGQDRRKRKHGHTFDRLGCSCTFPFLRSVYVEIETGPVDSAFGARGLGVHADYE